MNNILLIIIGISTLCQHAFAEHKEYNCVQQPVTPIVAQTTRKIFIKNAITSDMLTYKQHWSGHHTPKIWTLRINGKELDQGQNSKILLKKKIIKVVFYFEFWVFGKAHRKGSIELHYNKMIPNAHFSVEFCWDNPQRLLLIMHDKEKRVILKPIYVAEQEIK